MLSRQASTQHIRLVESGDREVEVMFCGEGLRVASGVWWSWYHAREACSSSEHTIASGLDRYYVSAPRAVCSPQ